MKKIFNLLVVISLLLAINVLTAQKTKTGVLLDEEVKATVTHSYNTAAFNYKYGKEYTGMNYAYLNVTANDNPTNAGYEIDIYDLENTNYYQYQVKIVSLNGKVFEDTNNIVPTNSKFRVLFQPGTDETGICEIKIYRKNINDNSKPYEWYKTIENIRLAPQHLISKDLPNNYGYNTGSSYDYNIYYTNDYFEGVEVSMTELVSYVEDFYIQYWKKIIDWELVKGFQFPAEGGQYYSDRPKDYNRNIEIVIYDGLNPYHSLDSIDKDKSAEFERFNGKSFTYIDPNKKKIFIPANIHEETGYKPMYENVRDAVATSIANGLYSIVQQSINQTFEQPSNWIYGAQALAMQSIMTDDISAEYKKPQTFYPNNINPYLKSPDSRLIPDKYLNGKPDDKLRYALYWRFLYENAVPKGTPAEVVEIFKNSYHYAYAGDGLDDIKSYMNIAFKSLPKGIYKSFEHSWTAFCEKMLYLDDQSLKHWGRWHDENNGVYGMPNFETSYSWDFNQKFDGQIKSSINNPLGMKFYKFGNELFFSKMDNNHNINFEFLGDNNAKWAVVVGLIQNDAKLTPIEAKSYVLPITNSKNKQKANFNLRKELSGLKGDLLNVEEMRIAVVRLDSKSQESSNYTITWNDGAGQELYILRPVSEYPAIIDMQVQDTLHLKFTVLDNDGAFIGDLNTSKIKLITDNGILSYDLNIIKVKKTSDTYVVEVVLPTDLPAGYYNVEVEAENTETKAIIKSKTPNSILIRNTFGCSGQEISLTGKFTVGKNPVIKLKDRTILDKVFSANKGIKIECIITDNDTLKLDRTMIHYRKTGTNDYFYYELRDTNIKNNYYINVPSTAVEFPGLDFYLSTEDKYGNRVTLPEENPIEHPFQLTIDTNDVPLVSVENEPELSLLAFDNPIKFDVNVKDEKNYIRLIGMRYRIEGQINWQIAEKTITEVRNDTTVTFSIPAGFSGMKSIEYFIYGKDNFDVIGYYGSPTYPKYLDFNLPAPKLIVPENNSEETAYAVDFIWEDLEELYGDLAYFYEYYLQVSDEPTFDNSFIDTLLTSNEATINALPYDIPLYWRVKAFVDSDESEWSEPFVFELNKPLPKIISTTYVDELCDGELILIEVVTNSGVWNYNWYKDGVIIPDEHNPILIINDAQLDNSGSYFCMVSNKINQDSVKSEIAIITVFDKPNITKQPNSAYVKLGQKATFEIGIKALGFAPDNKPIIEWFKGNVKLTEETHPRVKLEYIDTANVYKLNIYDIEESDYFDQYFVRISDRCSENYTISNEFTLGMAFDTTKVTILTQPLSEKVCLDENAELSILTSTYGNGNVTYQWYLDGGIITDGLQFVGSNTTDLTIRNFNKEVEGFYYCKISIMPDNVQISSATATVELLKLPVITKQSADIEHGQFGYNKVLFVVVAGDDLRYQWYKDDKKIEGETTNELILRDYTIEDEGNYYCEIWNRCGKVTANPIEVVDVTDNQYVSNQASVYPNPATNLTVFACNIEKSADIKVLLTDALGKTKAVLFDGYATEGLFNLKIDINYLKLSAGVYFIVTESPENTITTPLIIQK